MADTDDYYQLLGVSRNATEDEIKRAYLRLARELHPDANPGDGKAEEQFKRINLAYETLRDPERRRQYDMFGAAGVRGAGAAGAPATRSGFGGRAGRPLRRLLRRRRHGGAGRQARSGPRKGEDAEATLTLDFDEAVFGTQHEMTVRLPQTCDTCSGSGAATRDHPDNLRQLPGDGRGAPGPPVAPRPDGDGIPLPAMRRRQGRRSLRRASIAGAKAGAGRSGRSWLTCRPAWTTARPCGSRAAAPAACAAARPVTCMCTCGSRATRC